MGYIQFLGKAHYLQTRMKNELSFIFHITTSDYYMHVSVCKNRYIWKIILKPWKGFFIRLRSSSRNSFKIVTRIVRTRSRSYLICPAAVYTPDNVADKHWPIELAFLSVVISIHNFSLIGWKVGMVVTKSRDNEYIM